MRYKVTGYDRETGKRTTIEVDAGCHSEARSIAYRTMTYPTLGTDAVRELLASGPKPREK